MKLIVGLGNPGSEYAQTRHNAGFMVVDRLAVRHGLGGEGKAKGGPSPQPSPRGRGGGAKTKFHAGVIEGRVAGERCILMQPMTYMNRSGLAVGEAVSFYKLDVSEVLVVVDDLYLPLGKVRLRGEGSAGGHNGLSDIERSLGTRGYARLRIGIGAAGSENSEAGDGSARISQKDYVLGKFSQEEQEQLPAVLDRACDCIESWLREGLDKAMSRFNTDDGPLRGTR